MLPSFFVMESERVAVEGDALSLQPRALHVRLGVREETYTECVA